MAVLIEATSVIIRTEAVSTRVAGGWERFMAAVPTERVCSDDELISVMLIDPRGHRLRGFPERSGAGIRLGGRTLDVAFADQKRGLITPCDWVEFSTVNIGIGGTGPTVAIARMAGSNSHELRLPSGWRYQGSLSETFGADSPE